MNQVYKMTITAIMIAEIAATGSRQKNKRNMMKQIKHHMMFLLAIFCTNIYK